MAPAGRRAPETPAEVLVAPTFCPFCLFPCTDSVSLSPPALFSATSFPRGCLFRSRPPLGLYLFDSELERAESKAVSFILGSLSSALGSRSPPPFSPPPPHPPLFPGRRIARCKLASFRVLAPTGTRAEKVEGFPLSTGLAGPFVWVPGTGGVADSRLTKWGSVLGAEMKIDQRGKGQSRRHSRVPAGEERAEKWLGLPPVGGRGVCQEGIAGAPGRLSPNREDSCKG